MGYVEGQLGEGRATFKDRLFYRNDAFSLSLMRIAQAILSLHH